MKLITFNRFYIKDKMGLMKFMQTLQRQIEYEVHFQSNLGQKGGRMKELILAMGKFYT